MMNDLEKRELYSKYTNAQLIELKDSDYVAAFCLAERCNGCKIKDCEKPLELYTKSAEMGYSLAQDSLGIIYYYDKQDYEKAFYWFQKVANQGDDGAQFSLGDCYYTGNGIEQDYKKAAYWYKKSADQGNDFAQLELGLMYKNGIGVKKNYKFYTGIYFAY